MIGGEFAAASVVVTFGILLGRTSPLQLLVITLIECVCYSANESLNVQLLQAQDPGGSIQIHVFGTYYGLTVALLLYKKRSSSGGNNGPSHLSDMLVMIGELSHIVKCDSMLSQVHCSSGCSGLALML